MFNTTIVRPPEVHVHTKVEQKPHDAAEAARLYGELKAKAEADVANATVTRFGADNELTAVVVESRHDYLNDQPMARVLFRLNGALYDLTLKPDRQAVADGFLQEVATKLVGAIMGEMSRRLR